MTGNKYNVGKMGIALFLSVFAAYFLIPFLWMLSTSLRSPLVSFRLPPALFPTSFDLENYRMIFERVNFLAFFR